MHAIITNGLTKKYGKVVAVDDLHLSIKHGEFFSLLGVNGAGKTTTIKMLTGLTAPTAGEAQVCGFSITGESDAVKQKIAVAPQETAVAPNLTVEENLSLICGIYGFSKEETRIKIAELSQKLSLHSVLTRKAGKLSGGWQRRVSLAMALICQPEVLFLDEPTLGLDVIARQELWQILSALKGQTTVILTTHYLEEAQALSDRIGIMKDGRLLAVGTAEALCAKANTDHFETAFITLVKEAAQ